MKILCTICARGGSAGVKNKNIRMLRKKPLIAHSIIQAQRSNLFEKIVVSSDSARIRDIATQWGVDDIIVRPTELATSEAPKLPVIQHAFLEAEKIYGITFDYLVDLDATSPLRSVEDILGAFDFFINHPNAYNLVTGYRARRSPYFNMLEATPDGYVKLVKTPEATIGRRQDAPLCYDMNASIYIWKRDALLNTPILNDHTIIYEMPDERSIDIDSTLDWKIVQFLASKRQDL